MLCQLPEPINPASNGTAEGRGDLNRRMLMNQSGHAHQFGYSLPMVYDLLGELAYGSKST